MELEKEILIIKNKLEEEIKNIQNLKMLEEIRIKYIGKNGILKNSLNKIVGHIKQS